MAVDGRIDQLRLELRKVGYNEFQIRRMISEVIGNKRLTELTSEEIQSLLDHLIRQLDFARKCLNKDLAVGSET